MAEKEKNTTDFGADPSNFVNRELSCWNLITGFSAKPEIRACPCLSD